jgi:hydrocephalus-inducing protein
VRKPGNRAERPAVKMYSIWTPLPEQEKEAPAEGEEPSQPAEGEEAEPENKEPEMTDTKTRWIIQPKESCTLYIKFFTEEVGDFPQTLNFEIVGSTRQFALNLKACCAMPSINTNYKNVFFNQKRTRPPTAPESYLEKTYVVSEGVFDFGPLLIGKDSTKRAEDESL